MRFVLTALISSSVILSTAAGAQAANGAAPADARRPVCFGVELGAPCRVYTIIEGGGRIRLTTTNADPAERDATHAYPRLRTHGFIATGLAWPVGARSALGVIGELGGGDARQGIGVRYDRAMQDPLRLDLTAGVMRVETHQVGVTRRRMTAGPFGEATLHVADLFAVQARAEHFPGDGKIVKPGSAIYLGARIEGKPGLGAAGTALLLLTIFAFYAGLTSST